MARWQRDAGKERLWRRHIRRWQRSGLSIRHYCAAEGLVEHNFHAWKQTLGERDQEAAQVKPRRRQPARSAFVPVQVVTDAPAAATAIEVVLRSGVVLRVGPGCDPQHVRELVAVLEVPSC